MPVKVIYRFGNGSLNNPRRKGKKGIQVIFCTGKSSGYPNPFEGAVEITVALESQRSGLKFPFRTVENVVARHFKGSTQLFETKEGTITAKKAQGRWEGETERTVILKIINKSDELSWDEFQNKVIGLIHDLKTTLQQDKILFKWQPPEEAKFEEI